MMASSNNLDSLEFISKILVAQLKFSLRESGSSVATLSNSFMDMVKDVGELKALLESPGSADEVKEEALGICNRFLDRTIAGTVGFQFYDKLSQRLNHMAITLEQIGEYATDKDGAIDLKEIRESINSRHSMVEDQALFEALAAGDSIITAVGSALKKRNEATDVELF